MELTAGGSMRKRLPGPGMILGPATVVAVAYIDPGNFGTNIAAGSRFGLHLLWVVWISGFLAILFQYLSGKVGLATSASIVDLVGGFVNNRGYGRYARLLYFMAMMIMVLATDMAEFLGIVLGLSYLFNIPLNIAIWLGILDVLVLMIVADRRISFETIIGSLVGVVGFSLLYEVLTIGIDAKEVLRSSFIPERPSGEAMLIAVSILGATVMPHALILHPYLAIERYGFDRGSGLRKHLRETIAYLSIASLINASLQIMSNYAFHKNGYLNIDMDTAYIILQPLYGWLSSAVFAIALLASGVSSSMVSILAGQKIVESWVGKKLAAWKLRLAVRLFNSVPLAIAIHMGIKPIDILVYSQAVLSLTLPLVVIPITVISMDKIHMGSMVNRKITSILAIIGSIFIVGLNIWFLTSSIEH